MGCFAVHDTLAGCHLRSQITSNLDSRPLIFIGGELYTDLLTVANLLTDKCHAGLPQKEGTVILDINVFFRILIIAAPDPILRVRF